MNSYIYIRDLFEAFASANMDVQRYVCTSPRSRLQNEFNSAESFPVMYAIIDGGFLEDNSTNWTVTIGCVEQELSDKSNTDYALNRTHNVVNGCKTWLLKSDDLKIQLVGSPLPRKIENEFLDGLIGWEIDFSIDADAISLCDIPFENPPIISNYTCNISYTNKYLTCETLDESGTFQQVQADIIA